MTSEPEWGPWIEHDGKGCPCVGQYVHALGNYGTEWFGIAGSQCVDPNSPPSAWVNEYYPGYDDDFIIRYRIRKHRAMKLLQSIAENPPKHRIKEDA